MTESSKSFEECFARLSVERKSLRQSASEDLEDYLQSFWWPGKPIKSTKQTTVWKPTTTSIETTPNRALDRNFTVSVRMRPFLDHESDETECLIGLDYKAGTVWLPQDKDRKFQFHHVFTPAHQNEQVFMEIVEPIITSVCEGFNATVFAYGMTGSGKTYTMLGSPDNIDGLIPRSAHELFTCLEKDSSTRTFSVTASFVQLYNDEFFDLLVDPEKQASLDLKTSSDSGNYISGLSEVAVTSAIEVLTLLENGAARRHTHATECNKVSSRSHAIFTLNIERVLDNTTVTNVLNMVDLAGSERVKKSGATGARLDEAISINGSLLALSNVIHALTSDGGNRRSHIPYRSSKLTRLLQNSLGGNCKTALICTLSPISATLHESERSLAFAVRATYVKNEALIAGKEKKRKSEQKREQRLDAELEKAANERIPSPDFFNDYIEIPNPVKGRNSIKAQAFGQSKDPTVICLHGYPSSSDEMAWLFPFILAANFKILAIDMPGFGESEGERLPSRSENITDSGGPVDIVLGAMNYFGIKKATVIGSDWGGGIGLSMAVNNPKRIKALVLIHSTYTEQKKDELKAIKQPILLFWSKRNQFHPYKWATDIKRKCRRSTLIDLKSDTYDEQVGSNLPSWLLSLKQKKKSRSRSRRPGSTRVRSDSRSPTSRSDARRSPTASSRSPSRSRSRSQSRSRSRSRSPATNDIDLETSKEAIIWFKKFWEAGLLPILYGAVTGKGNFQQFKPAAMKLFSSLPVLNNSSLSSPELLVELGIWTAAPKGWEKMKSSPRYFVGRDVIAPVPVNPSIADKHSYLSFDTNSDELFSVVGKIHGIKKEAKTMKMTIDINHTLVEVAHADIFRLNQPHTFDGDDDVLRFEDGIKIKWTRLLTKARLLEMAFSLDEFVSRLDFEDTKTRLDLQQKCIKRLRTVMNITCLYDGVDRRRSSRSQDVSKLITYGQGHCHGLTSTFAAILQPFANLLGIDVLYRKGFHFYPPGGQVSNSIDRHHWIELHYRPGMESATCDLTSYLRSERFADLSELYVPLRISYSYLGGLYPHTTLNRFVRSREVIETDVQYE